MATAKYQDVSVYNGTRTVKELQEIRKVLAKRANQRIVRLERAISPITGESYASYGAIDLIKVMLKQQGRNRISESLNWTDDVRRLKREISAIQNFLNSKTSTVKGQRSAEEKRAQTFESGKWKNLEEMFGNEATTLRKKIQNARNEEFYRILGSASFRALKKLYPSEQLIDLVDDALSKGKTSRMVIEEINAIVEEALRGEVNNINDLYSRITGVKFNGKNNRNKKGRRTNGTTDDT